MAVAPSARRLSPSARRRSRRRTAGGGGAGWRHRGCLKRVMPPNPRTRKYRPGATAPRACRLRVGTPAKNDAASAANPAQIMAASRLSPRIPIRTPAVAATDTGRLAVGVKAGSGRRLTGRQEPVVRFGCGFLRSKKSAVLLKRSGMSGSSVEHCVRLKDFVHWCVRWG